MAAAAYLRDLGTRRILPLLSSGTQGELADFEVDVDEPETVVVGDLDGDGDLDAFVVNIEDQPNEVWLNDGAGFLSDSGQQLGSSYSFAAALGDVDADGEVAGAVPDGALILVASGGHSAWYRHADGRFERLVLSRRAGAAGLPPLELVDVREAGDGAVRPPSGAVTPCAAHRSWERSSSVKVMGSFG